MKIFENEQYKDDVERLLTILENDISIQSFKIKTKVTHKMVSANITEIYYVHLANCLFNDYTDWVGNINSNRLPQV
jgi:hypothetical protein